MEDFDGFYRLEQFIEILNEYDIDFLRKTWGSLEGVSILTNVRNADGKYLSFDFKSNGTLSISLVDKSEKL